jgi:hypothetical protein
MGSARTLPAGRTQLFVAPQATGAFTGGQPDLMPQLELGVRHGLREGVELGAKLGIIGLLLDAKLQLCRADEGWDLAVDPALGYGTYGIGSVGVSRGTHVLDVHLPLLLGRALGPTHQLVLGPRLVYRQVWLANSGASSFLFAGGSVGWYWRVGPTLRLMPELSVHTVLAGSSTLTSRAVPPLSGLGFQGGVAVLWGGE